MALRSTSGQRRRVEDVEGEVGEHCCIAPLHRRGEVVEVRDAALVRGSDLAVEPDLPAELGQTGEDWAKESAALVAVARQQPDAAVAVGDDGEAMAVVFHFIEPAVAGRRLARRRGELEGDARR
jgi:hypothetical protein